MKSTKTHYETHTGMYMFGVLALLIVLLAFLFLGDRNSETIQVDDCGDQPTTAEKLQCWLAMVETELDKGDTEGALTMVAELAATEPEFNQSCHDFMHEIGKQTFLRFSDGEPLSVNEHISLCTYGFYHGFIETLIQNTGDYNDAREFCSSVNESLASNVNVNQDTLVENCYHGIGHGTLNDHGSDKADPYKLTEQTLQLCHVISDSDLQLNECATGVFNGVANYYLSGELGWELDINNPAAICSTQPDRFKNTCYAFMARVITDINDGDITQALQQLDQTVPTEYVGNTIKNMSLVWMMNQRYSDSAKIVNAIEVCRGPAQEQNQIACIEGLVAGIVQSGSPKVPEVQINTLCMDTKLNQNERYACFAYALENVERWYPPREAGAFAARISAELDIE